MIRLVQQRSNAPSGPTLHDGATLARVASGDLDALGLLYDRYAPELLRFVQRIDRTADATELVQSVFLRVVSLAPSFDADSASARIWLFGISARLVEKRGSWLRRLLSAVRARRAGSPPPCTDLERALRRLSQTQRTLLILADVEHFTSAEIATMLAIPLPSVWRRLHQARRELRARGEGGP